MQGMNDMITYMEFVKSFMQDLLKNDLKACSYDKMDEMKSTYLIALATAERYLLK